MLVDMWPLALGISVGMAEDVVPVAVPPTPASAWVGRLDFYRDDALLLRPDGSVVDGFGRRMSTMGVASRLGEDDLATRLQYRRRREQLLNVVTFTGSGLLLGSGAAVLAVAVGADVFEGDRRWYPAAVPWTGLGLLALGSSVTLVVFEAHRRSDAARVFGETLETSLAEHDQDLRAHYGIPDGVRLSVTPTGVALDGTF